MASQGPNNPGTGADDAATGTEVWTSPGNVFTSNDVDASVGLSSGQVTHYLKATNFGLSIPAGATIDGIVVEIERAEGTPGTSGHIRDSRVRIVKADGTVGTTDKADTGTDWPTSDTYKTYSSSTDLWGETWTPADINDADFGVVLSVTAVTSNRTAYVDHVRITVHYTEAGGSLAFARKDRLWLPAS